MSRTFFFAVLMAGVLWLAPPVQAATDTAKPNAVWPTVQKPRSLRLADEKRIAAIVARMTLREKLDR